MSERPDAVVPAIPWRPALITVVVAAAGLLASCGSMAKMAYLELMPMRGFETHAGNTLVHFERGAEGAAEAVVEGLDAAVRQIETSHGAALLRRPDVYVCASTACYERNAFTPLSRAETRPLGHSVILQGGLLLDEKRLQAVLTHELSHVFWFERGIRCHPRWWTEGLAVESSGGGGAELQPASAAMQALRDGAAFTELEESCLERDSASRAGMGWPMFYRQAGMFVGWLRAHDGAAFGNTLAQLREGAGLRRAIESSFAAPLPALWQDWRRSVAEAAR